MIFIPALLNIRSVFNTWRRGKVSESGEKVPSESVPSMSKAANISPSLQLNPEGEWDLEIFYVELKKLIVWDLERRLSSKGTVRDEFFYREVDKVFDLDNPENPIAKSCRAMYEGGGNLKDLYEEIRLNMVFG